MEFDSTFETYDSSFFDDEYMNGDLTSFKPRRILQTDDSVKNTFIIIFSIIGGFFILGACMCYCQRQSSSVSPNSNMDIHERTAYEEGIQCCIQACFS